MRFRRDLLHVDHYHRNKVSGPTVSTERMFLRLMIRADRKEYVRMHSARWELLQPWSPRVPAGISFDELFHRQLPPRETRIGRMSGFRFVAILADGRMAGVFTLSEVVRGVFQNAYAGWRVDPGLWGQGLATEGVQALLDIAFAPAPDGLGLHRVQANIMPHNVRSLRVAEKVGFRREGYADWYLEIDGRWQDHVTFALVSDEHKFRYITPRAVEKRSLLAD